MGVHIADVSHYVTPGSILDDEAVERATSVYLVDRVVPMLPEILSNGACSLRPNEDKHTFRCFRDGRRGQYFEAVVRYSHSFGLKFATKRRKKSLKMSIRTAKRRLHTEIRLLDKLGRSCVRSA